MCVDVNGIDFENIADISEITPPPTLALSDKAHFLGPIEARGRKLMLALLDATDANEPTGERVFGRLGLSYRHASWNGWELFWADDAPHDVVLALERWHAAQRRPTADWSDN